MPITWLKRKYSTHKFAKQIATKGSGNSAVRAARRKLNAAEKAKLSPQPKLTMLIGPNGKSKMVKID